MDVDSDNGLLVTTADTTIWAIAVKVKLGVYVKAPATFRVAGGGKFVKRFCLKRHACCFVVYKLKRRAGDYV